MSELVTMYPAQANSPETSLSGALTAAGTTVNVVDGSVLPEAPNLLTIGADGSTAETVLMTAKNGNVLTVTRAQNGTTARAWSAGDVIARYFTAADQTAMQENIKKLNEGKAEKAASPTAGNFAGLDSSGNLTDSGKKPATLPTPPTLTRGYAEVKIFSGVSVAASAWVSDSTYAAYPYARLYRLPRRDGEPRPRDRVRCDRGRERKLCAGRSLRERDGQNLRRDKADGGYHGAEHYLY